MALAHAQSGEPVDVRPLGAQLAGAQSVALFKSQDLEVMRVVLPQGKTMPSHSVRGEVTLQCLEGEVDIRLPDSVRPLQAGQLMYLGCGVAHALQARSDASLLLTIALKH